MICVNKVCNKEILMSKIKNDFRNIYRKINKKRKKKEINERMYNKYLAQNTFLLWSTPGLGNMSIGFLRFF